MNADDLARLREGVEIWNQSRRKTPILRPDLSGALLSGADLSGADLSGANLSGALLLSADLSSADLSGANLSDADLSGVLLLQTNLESSTLDGCRVYGASIWNLRLTGASQAGLRIGRGDEPEITVDDLEVAQFMYLLLNNAKLRSVIDTVTAKAVLILGRFTPPERKSVLDGLHAELRHRGYLPILFDFDRPSSRSTTETVLTLASMARFVIADLTDAASVQQELSAIAFSPLTSIPVQPVLLRGSREWSMFVDLPGKAPILPPYVYDSPEELLAALPDHVISPAEREAEALRAARERREAEAVARRTGL